MPFPVFGEAWRPFGAPLGSASAAQSYAAYIQSALTPVWLRLQETSGNPANAGSLALTMTNTVATQGITGAPEHGIARANDAYDFAGDAASGGIISVANNATLKTWTTQRWAFLVHLDSLGASSAGKFGVWGALGATDHLLMSCVSSNRLQSTINTNGTNANVVTNVNQISDCIGVWAWFFMDYDDADSLGNGRRIRLFKGVAGVVTQLTLATNTAGTGTVDQPTTALQFGNILARNSTLDGQFDEIIGAPSLWTTAEMQKITNFFV